VAKAAPLVATKGPQSIGEVDLATGGRNSTAVTDDAAGMQEPMRVFFAEMNELRHRAGLPSMRRIAGEVNCSHTTVSSAFHGPGMPRFGLIELIVEYLQGDVERFRQLWYEATGGAPGEPELNTSLPNRDTAEHASDREPRSQYRISGDYVSGDKYGGDTIVSGGKHVYTYPLDGSFQPRPGAEPL
jgi:hypothetical protein